MLFIFINSSFSISLKITYNEISKILILVNSFYVRGLLYWLQYT